MNEDKDLTIIGDSDLDSLDQTAKHIVQYVEDDRRKADQLYDYFKSLIENGDGKGETREGLAKSLQLREASARNLIDILKIKAKILERKIMSQNPKVTHSDGMRSVGTDNSDLINEVEDR